MAKTLKDKKEIYRSQDERVPGTRMQPEFRRRFLNYKKSGPPADGENCPECGGLTEFSDGYLVCNECGWAEDVGQMFDRERFAV